MQWIYLIAAYSVAVPILMLMYTLENPNAQI